MSDFIERPYENEKNKAIKYVKQLLDKASVDNKQSDKDELAENVTTDFSGVKDKRY